MGTASILFLSFSFLRRFFLFTEEKKAAKEANQVVCIVPVTVSTASPGSAVKTPVMGSWV